MPSQGSQQSFCNTCQRHTNHEALFSHSRVYRESQTEYPRGMNENWVILQCLGCESIKVRILQTSADSSDIREIQYPATQIRIIPKWTVQLPEEIHHLVEEVYKALNANCPSLSTMGTRAIVDTLLNKLVGDIGGFAHKLSEAVANGFLTVKQKETIESAVEAGHAASHRGFRPSVQQVTDTLEIVEHALADKYVIGPTSSRLSASIPPRPQGGS
jgi:Domain of unknown function (DUF4145)